MNYSVIYISVLNSYFTSYYNTNTLLRYILLKKNILIYLCAFFCFFLSSCSPINSGKKFDSITNDFFTSELSSNSLNLHYTLSNPKKYNISQSEFSLGHISSNQCEKDKKKIKEYLNSLKHINYNSLSKKQKLDYDVLSDYLLTQLKLYDYYFYQEFLSPSGGIHIELPLLLSEYRFNSKDDIENYLSILSIYDKYFEEISDFEKAKSKQGLFMNDTLCVQVLKECEDFVDKSKENYLISSFNKRINDCNFLSSSEKADYIAKNNDAYNNHVIPAYSQLIESLINLLGCGRNDGGLCNFKEGKKYYELLVYNQTGCSDSIDKINSLITDSRKESLNQMKKLLSKSSDLAHKCENYEWKYSDENDMIDTLKTNINNDFPKICDCKCNVCFVDKSLSDSLAPAFYITAPIDDYFDNYIYINDAKNYSSIKYFTTLAHEGFPGHLYQTVMSYNYGLSPFRTLLNYGGFTEGWATYSEMLSYHYAGLEEDVANYLQLNQEATLSLYASSDIGIHYYGWDFKDMCKLWNEFGKFLNRTISYCSRM